jgi:hypothetical protein
MVSAPDTDNREFLESIDEVWASNYQDKYERSPLFQSKYLDNPQTGLEFFLQNSFERAGGGRAGYNKLAVQELRACVNDAGGYQNFIQSASPQDEVWRRFKDGSMGSSTGLNQSLNEAVVKGLVILAKESDADDFNPFVRISNLAKAAGILSAWGALRAIKGIGDKIASLVVRDIVSIMAFESSISKEERVFLQPVDIWIRRTVQIIWRLDGRMPDWALAMRTVSELDKLGLSGVRFNQGAWYYGSEQVRRLESLESEIESRSWKIERLL